MSRSSDKRHEQRVLAVQLLGLIWLALTLFLGIWLLGHMLSGTGA